MLISLQNLFRCGEAVEVNVRNAVLLLHSLRQRQRDIMHDDVHLRCGSTADFLCSAAAGQLYADFHACCLQKCVQLRVGKVAHALAQNVDATVAVLLLHHCGAGSNGALQAGEVILALKVLGVHRHYRNAVLLRQLCGNGIVIIAYYLNYAGGDEHHALRLIFRHNFFERLVHAFGAAEGYIMAVEYNGNAASRNTAVALVNGEAFGVIAAFVRAYDYQQAIVDTSCHHRRAHQRTVGAGEQRCCELGHILDCLHLAQAVQTA